MRSSPSPSSPYTSPWWLPGGHTQTLYALLRKGVRVPLQRERIDTPDGDFVDFDWLHPAPSASAPLLVLFHGLEGSSASHYARSLLAACSHAGWHAVLPHFRGCSGTPNRLTRAYHSGDSDEIDWMLRTVRARHPQRPLYAVGVSLGGNALLKWLGEREEDAARLTHGAAAICPPLDLTLCGTALGRGFNRLYTRHFLRTLKPKAMAKLAHAPGLFDAAALHAARSLYGFDDVYTAPAHGFANAADYWRRASSRPWLRHIKTPTLLLTAANDPFVPPAALPAAHELAPALRHEHLASGGHVGFLAAPWPGHLSWLPQRMLHHFTHDC